VTEEKTKNQSKGRDSNLYQPIDGDAGREREKECVCVCLCVYVSVRASGF